MANSGTFKKGDGRPRKPRGATNKLTAALKDLILQSLSDAGGTAYLVRQAHENPNAFMALLGRVLPLQVKESDDEPCIPTTIVHHIYKP